MPTVKANQQNSLGQEVYIKMLPESEVIDGQNGQVAITEESLLEQKTMLEARLAEVDADLDDINSLKK